MVICIILFLFFGWIRCKYVPADINRRDAERMSAELKGMAAGLTVAIARDVLKD